MKISQDKKFYYRKIPIRIHPTFYWGRVLYGNLAEVMRVPKVSRSVLLHVVHMGEVPIPNYEQ